jgi:hypothetical protein
VGESGSQGPASPQFDIHLRQSFLEQLPEEDEHRIASRCASDSGEDDWVVCSGSALVRGLRSRFPLVIAQQENSLEYMRVLRVRVQEVVSAAEQLVDAFDAFIPNDDARTELAVLWQKARLLQTIVSGLRSTRLVLPRALSAQLGTRAAAVHELEESFADLLTEATEIHACRAMAYELAIVKVHRARADLQSEPSVVRAGQDLLLAGRDHVRSCMVLLHQAAPSLVSELGLAGFDYEETRPHSSDPEPGTTRHP